MSCHVPYFTQEGAVQSHRDGYEQFQHGKQRYLRAACGEYVWFPREHSEEPTCEKCAAWLVRDAEEVARIDAGMEP